ncbi:MAG: hypothetical protein JNN07_09470 [Verrucomicrobiales bacterium]|nr:hypothetical protein [Verrucomicrobiales bacterium]
MNEHELQELMEAAWRRPLTRAERGEIEGWCSQHPDRRAEVELELQAARGVVSLPDVPVPSHFMSQVWREIDRQEAASRRPVAATASLRDWRAWIPRFAVAALVLTVGLSGWQRYQTRQRTQVAAEVQQVFKAASIPDPEMLQELDTLKLLVETPSSVDVELLAALQ